MTENSSNQQPVWERIALFASGLLLIITILWIALIVPEPTDFQYTIFRIILALSGAAFAALIPGVLEIEHKGLLRAGGALAVLILVFFFSVSSPTSSKSAGTTSSTKTTINGDCNVIGSTNSINCNNDN